MKKLFAFLLLIPSSVFGTVLIDTQTASGIHSTVGYSSWTMTMGSGANRAIVIGCEANAASPSTVSSVTVNNIHATRQNLTKNSLDAAEIWVSTNVNVGVNFITVTLPGSYSDAITLCGSVGLENVDLTTPVDVSSGAINHTSMTVTTTGNGAMLVDVVGQGTSATVPTPETDQTLRWGTINGGRFTGAGGSTKSGGTAGSKTMSWPTIPSNNAMSMVAVKASASAPDISSMTPSTRGFGQGGFTITINGTGFVSGSTVTWNGERRETTFVNSGQITAVILSTDTVSISTQPIRVVNPDNGRSDNTLFSVTGDLTKFWVTDGGYKPDADTLYGTLNSTTVASTRIWDGQTARPFQAKNEVNGFAIVMENDTVVDSTISVRYPVLTHSSGYVISSTPVAKANLWDWRTRPIQLYQVRFLQIRGLSKLGWDSYDELHVPARMRATYSVNGNGQGEISGGWTSRGDHNKSYPDPLIPMEAVDGSTFTVRRSSVGVIWVDVYVPKNAPAGTYTGQVDIYEGPNLSTSVPISLYVYPFTMPDSPPSAPFAYLSLAHVNQRQGGTPYPNYGNLSSSQTVTRMRYYQELWRHGVTPVGDAEQAGCGTLGLSYGPCPEFQIQLDGTLFDPTSGYANAPGIRTGVPVYMMYSYGSWRGSAQWPYTSSATCTNANYWVNYFQKNHPNVDYFWYMEDEPADLTNSIMWSTWVSTCPSPGNQLPTFVTVHPERVAYSSSTITHIATTKQLGVFKTEEDSVHYFNNNSRRRITYYNGERPWAGTTVTDAEGVSFRVMGWMQFKKKFDHYFIWETTNYESGGEQNDLFNDAKTFGYYTSDSATYGRTGFQYSNGDGLLLYPGQDLLFPNDSYGVDGPFPSWRLKMWRRGINDHTYLTMAYKIDPKRVNEIVQRIIPQVVWERGVFDSSDPTYQYGDVSWSIDPDVWERAREELAQIISSHR